MTHDPLATKALDFCQRVMALADPDEIRSAIEHELADFGIEYITCGDLPIPGRPPNAGLLMNTRPEAYTRRYLAKNYTPIDPALTEMQHTLRPFTWNDIRTFRKPEKRKLLIVDEARDFKMTDGMTIPIVTASGEVSAFCPSGEKPQFDARSRSAIELISIAGFQALRRAEFELKQAQAAKPLLTLREREIMHWVAAGKTDEEIGEILNLSSNTTAWHLKNAMRKLNTTRRAQAVAIAVRDKHIRV